jgi:hypothetical protein
MALGDLRAAGNGTLHTSLHLSETLPAGTHYLSFRGNRSQRGSFAKLVLEQGPVLPGEE